MEKSSLLEERPTGSSSPKKEHKLQSSLNERSAKAFFRRLLLSEYFVLYLTIVYVLVLTPFIPRIFHPWNIQNLMSNTWPLLAVAIGQTFVLIIAGIDLSQTSVMALSSVVGAMIMTTGVDPILFQKSPMWGILLGENGGILAGSLMAVPVAVLAMLGVGLLIGLWNGISVAHFKMPPFIVTLVSMMLFSAVAIYLPKSENIRNLPEAYLNISKSAGGYLSLSLVIAVGLAVFAHLLLSKTLFGRRIYAVGINTKASQISGVPTKRVIITAYVISSLCAVVAAILYSSRLEMGRPTLGNTLLLDIVGANIIGGMSLMGGKGKITWTFFGVFFFIILANTLNLLNLSFYVIDIVKGSVILVAALLDVTRNRIRESRG